MGAWQARPSAPMYPLVFFDTLRVKIRKDAVARNNATYLALGLLPDGVLADLHEGVTAGTSAQDLCRRDPVFWGDAQRMNPRRFGRRRPPPAAAAACGPRRRRNRRAGLALVCDHRVAASWPLHRPGDEALQGCLQLLLVAQRSL